MGTDDCVISRQEIQQGGDQGWSVLDPKAKRMKQYEAAAARVAFEQHQSSTSAAPSRENYEEQYERELPGLSDFPAAAPSNEKEDDALGSNEKRWEKI